jgi:endonuclease YncB( thermonuclease family)
MAQPVSRPSPARRWIVYAVAACAGLLTVPVIAGGTFAAGERGTVASVEDGDSFTLAGGQVVRLAQIEAPRMRDGDATAAAARTALAAMVSSRPVQLRYGGLRRDRRGRALAQVYAVTGRADGEVWVQEALLQAGMARVHTYADNRAEVPRLWAAEREARRAGRGLWSDPAYQVRFATPEALSGGIGTFQLMEGTVTAVERRGRVVVLGFGEDRDSDVSVTIPETALPLWPGGEDAVTALDGRTIRVRGLVRMNRGPSVWVDHPEQIEYIRTSAPQVTRP